MSTYVSEVLQQNQNVVLPFVTDTIDVRFLVSSTGVLTLSEVATHTTKDRSTADLKTVLRSALNDLPTICLCSLSCHQTRTTRTSRV